MTATALRLCSVDDCSREATGARGMCTMHYHRLWRTGQLGPLPKPERPHIDLPPHVTYRQFDYWTSHRYILVDQPHPGSGGRRSISASEYRILETMGALVDAGLVAATAARVARDLATNGRAQLAGFTLRAEQDAPGN